MTVDILLLYCSITWTINSSAGFNDMPMTNIFLAPTEKTTEAICKLKVTTLQQAVLVTRRVASTSAIGRIVPLDAILTQNTEYSVEGRRLNIPAVVLFPSVLATKLVLITSFIDIADSSSNR